MELLPNDILVKILNELSIAGIVTCLASCKKLNEQNYENLWQSKCLEFGIAFDAPSACESNIRTRFKSLSMWSKGKYKVKSIVSTDLKPYNQVDQRTSVALYGENIIWATCAGELLLRNHEDEIIDRIKVHSSQIWWIEIDEDLIYSVSTDNPTVCMLVRKELERG